MGFGFAAFFFFVLVTGTTDLDYNSEHRPSPVVTEQMLKGVCVRRQFASSWRPWWACWGASSW